MKRRHAVAPLLSIAASIAFAACSGSDEKTNPTPDGNDAATTATSGAGGQAGGAATGSGGSGGVAPAPERATISGDSTWNVTFDATAQAAGMKDCSYTRHYEGVEDRSAPWVCPACEITFRAAVEMTVGKTDCFKQFSADEPAAEEWIGYGNGVWYRGYGLTTDQGTAMVDEKGVTIANSVMALDVPAGGTMSFAVTGSMTFGKEEGDPLNGFVAPDTYACGWPKANPPAYTGDYTVAKGAMVPDGIFRDSCGEAVRLHDFKGSYLIIDMAARDCPPCQSMAGDEEQFVADMKAQGIDVQIITLLAPSLTDTLGETTKAMLDGWISKYTLTSPVLGDRAWGLAMFVPLFPDTIGYPSWVLVDPDLKVMDFGTGYGGFAPLKSAILADAN